MNKYNKIKEPYSDNKIIVVIITVVVLALGVIFITYMSTTLFFGARAFVYGESIWTKAQKEASLQLVRYTETQNERYYEQYKKKINIPLGYKQARIELDKETPDLSKVYEGIQRGQYIQEDIETVIWIYRNFKWNPSMQRVIEQWRKGDRILSEFVALGESLHQQIENNDLSTAEKEQYIEEIYQKDRQISEFQSNFSLTVAESTLYLINAVFWGTLIIAFIVVTAGAFFAIRFMGNVRQWSEYISRSEQKFRTVLENTKDVLYQLDLNSLEYLYMSPTVKQAVGYSADQIMEEGPQFFMDKLHPDDAERMASELKKIKEDTNYIELFPETQFRFKTSRGKYIWAELKRSIVTDDAGAPRYLFGTVRDITDRKEYEKRIDTALEEKKVLIQEIHHRVKNNLAIISGLMYLRLEDLEGPARSIMQEMQNRVNAVAMVHEKLYGSASLSNINLDNYITELVEAIEDMYQQERKKISIRYNMESLKIDIVHAVQFGLAANEMVSNAFKHAFKNKEKGKIELLLFLDNKKIVFIVQDNGSGMPQDFDLQSSTTLGMMLIQSFVNQMSGEMNIESSSEGTTIRLEINDIFKN